MRIRRFLQRQVYRLQKVAAPLSLLLLIANLSLTFLSLVQWRGLNPYATVSLTIVVLSFAAVLFANIYTVGLKMHIAERRAIVDHDPIQVYAFLPFQSAIMLEQSVPMMKAIASLTADEALKARAEKLERWAKQGFIPREEYPPELAEYYRTGGRKI